jgi:hypothetical protein
MFIQAIIIFLFDLGKIFMSLETAPLVVKGNILESKDPLALGNIFRTFDDGGRGYMRTSP